ncbi:MAG TPA: hypothetical protein VK517_02780 [Cyclobacteriaceae bacterium]|nr:hypothetical protein [Cyclobacteriaceae bacterium]
MKNDIENQFEALSLTEMNEITGGESLWYWAAYGVGSIGRGVSYLWKVYSMDPVYYMQYTM